MLSVYLSIVTQSECVVETTPNWIVAIHYTFNKNFVIQYIFVITISKLLLNT